MSIARAVQVAIRARLTSVPAVTSLVPVNAILDRNARPAPTPSIILGEAQEVLEDSDTAQRRVRVFSTLHVFFEEEGLVGAQTVAGNVREALHWQRLSLAPPYHCIWSKVTGIRLMRDPDGETSHAVVTVESLVLQTEVPEFAGEQHADPPPEWWAEE